MKPTLSFEFFPPRSAVQSRRFWRTLGCLETLSPDWVSITWGALGSASQASLDTLAALQQENSIPVAAHLTCAGQTEEQMHARIDELLTMGVSRLVALRGDAIDGQAPAGAMQHACDLVSLIANRDDCHQLDISVAAYPEIHPEAATADDDIRHLKAKLDAGASRALTQLFFDTDMFLRWRDRVVSLGIDKPVVPGILPIHDIDKVIEFSGRCGASVPSDLIARFRQAGDADGRRELAVEHAVSMCQQLQGEGLDSFHFYTLNQSALSYSISCELLGDVESRRAAA